RDRRRGNSAGRHPSGDEANFLQNATTLQTCHELRIPQTDVFQEKALYFGERQLACDASEHIAAVERLAQHARMALTEFRIEISGAAQVVVQHGALSDATRAPLHFLPVVDVEIELTGYAGADKGFVIGVDQEISDRDGLTAGRMAHQPWKSARETYTIKP